MKKLPLLDNAKYQLDLVLSFIDTIDTRASILLGLNLGLLGILASNITKIKIIYTWPVLLPVICIVFSTASFYHLYKCLYPQLKGGKKSIVYFKEVAYRTENNFISDFKKISSDKYAKEILSQVWRNSQIVKCKFEHLKCAFIYLLLNIPLWLMSLAILGLQNNGIILK